MAYDRKKNTVDAVNYSIRLNRLNDTTGDRADGVNIPFLAEDLSNLVDVGTAVANLDADQFKDFKKEIAMFLGKMEIMDRVYTAETFGIVKNDVEFNGALERICVKALAKIMPSSANNLVYGQSYLDGKYYGAELHGVVFTDENTNFKIPYSIGYEDIKARFTDESWVIKTVEAWRNMVHTTLEVHLKGIADDLINRMIIEANNLGHTIHLVTMFNEYFGYEDAYTWAEIKASEELMKQYEGFSELITNLVADGFSKLQKGKYNNGEVLTFTPKNKIRIIGLTEYVKDIDFFGRANRFRADAIPQENIVTTLSWQSDGDGLVPALATCGKVLNGTITVSNGKVTAQNVADELDNVVAVMYDEDMLGVTATLNKIGIEEVQSELFNTYHHHYACRQYLDLRGNAVVFMLD